MIKKVGNKPVSDFHRIKFMQLHFYKTFQRLCHMYSCCILLRFPCCCGISSDTASFSILHLSLSARALF